MMNMIAMKKNSIRNRITSTIQNFMQDRKGEGYLDVAMKILITVVLGAAILAILNTAVPGLFTDMINKISTEWANVTILP